MQQILLLIRNTMMNTLQSRNIIVIGLAVILVFALTAAWQPALANLPARTTATLPPDLATPTGPASTPVDTLTSTPSPVDALESTPTANVEAAIIENPVATGSISVSGNAQVMIAPDEVVLVLGMETHDMDLAVAKQQNDEIIKKVLELTTQYKIDPKYVQTDYINIEPRYNSTSLQNDTFLGYFVRKTVEVRLQDISMFEDFYSDVLGAGVTNVHGIEFRTTELRKYRDQARELALKAAREKAEAMAAVYGQSVGQVKNVVENSNNWWGSYNSWWGSYSGAMYQNVIQNAGPGSNFSEEETLAPGQIAVSASVNVEFELLK
jgi:uncharacterized protein YggE